MEKIFCQTYTISGMHLDCYGRVKPSALLYFAQNAAGGHCVELGLDWDTLAKQGMFWAVIRHRLQILRYPAAGETLTVKTWPMPTTRSSFPRACVGYDSQGNEVFRTIGLWVLMDMNTRAMILPGKSGIDLEGVLLGGEIEAPGSIVPQPLENTAQRRVSYTDLDRNGHMTNTRYLDWIDDLLPSQFHAEHPVSEVVICYLAEAVETQTLTMNWQVAQEDYLQVDGRREQTDVPGKQTRVFAAKVYF